MQDSDNKSSLGRVFQDSSKYLVDVLFHNLKGHVSNDKRIQYFVNLGDIPQHYADKTIQKDTISYFVEHVKQLFENKNVTMINCLGNNEGNGNYNYSSFPDDEHTLYLINECKMKELFNNQEELKQFTKYTYYIVDDKDKKIRSIQLNSVLLSMAYMQYYQPKYLSMEDVEGQLKWLEDRLVEAKQLGYQVLIFSHVPFGVNGWNGQLTTTDKITSNYKKIIYAYRHIIIAEFFGHYHQDLLRYHQTGLEQYVPGFVCPSLSQSNGNNPGYRIFQLIRGTDGKWIVNDYWSYYLNTQLYNQLIQVEKDQVYFQLQYSFKQFYQTYVEYIDSTAPTAQNIKYLMENMLDDPHLQTEYHTNMKALQFEQTVSYACETTYLLEEDVRKCITTILLLLMQSNLENHKSPHQI